VGEGEIVFKDVSLQRAWDPTSLASAKKKPHDKAAQQAASSC
jgi:hypothetical protein